MRAELATGHGLGLWPCPATPQRHCHQRVRLGPSAFTSTLPPWSSYLVLLSVPVMGTLGCVGARARHPLLSPVWHPCRCSAGLSGVDQKGGRGGRWWLQLSILVAHSQHVSQASAWAQQPAETNRSPLSHLTLFCLCWEG